VAQLWLWYILVIMNRMLKSALKNAYVATAIFAILIGGIPAAVLFLVYQQLHITESVRPARSEKSPPVLPVHGILYKIKIEDTLNSIAEKFNSTPADIANFNGIRDDAELVPGNFVVVPTVPNPTSFEIPDFNAPAHRPDN
jgi:hypothetical protein